MKTSPEPGFPRMITSQPPRIGITPDINDKTAPETEYFVRRNYADARRQAGGLPFILPYSGDAGDYLDVIDGLLVTGGMFDIDRCFTGRPRARPM